MNNSIIFLVLVGLTAFAQQSVSENPVLLNTQSASLYVQFEHTGKRTPVHAGESEQGAWLRLRNNTKAAIAICTESLYVGSKVAPLKLGIGKDVLALRDGVEVSVCYSVEELNANGSKSSGKNIIATDQITAYQTLPLGFSGHVSSTSWIPAGSSVLISVPVEHLSTRRRISIQFNFEWEQESRNVSHRAFFSAAELPAQGR